MILLTVLYIDEHDTVLRKWLQDRLQIRVLSIDDVGPINQSACIEGVARELSNLRTHSVLDIEEVRLVPVINDSFKEATIEFAFGQFLVDEGCWQLAWISEKYNFFNSHLERD